MSSPYASTLVKIGDIQDVEKRLIAERDAAIQQISAAGSMSPTVRAQCLGAIHQYYDGFLNQIEERFIVASAYAWDRRLLLTKEDLTLLADTTDALAIASTKDEDTERWQDLSKRLRQAALSAP